MSRLRDAAHVLECFRAIDLDDVYVPPDLSFPLTVRDYVAWPEPSGARVSLVFEEPISQQLIGVVFRRGRTPPDAPAAMCQWCHAVRVGGAVTMMTASIDRDRRVGLYLCASLNCRENALTTPVVHDTPESIPPADRVKCILVRMSAFVRRSLLELDVG